MTYLDKLPKGKRYSAIKTYELRLETIRRVYKNLIDHIIKLPIEDPKDLSERMVKFIKSCNKQVESFFENGFYQVESKQLKKIKKDLNKYSIYADIISTLKVNQSIEIKYKDLLYNKQILHLLKDIKVKEVFVLMNFDKQTNNLDKKLFIFKRHLLKKSVELHKIAD